MDDNESITYYIDTITGTWGEADDIRLITVERGAEAAMLVNTLDDISEGQIVEYGLHYGREVG